MAGTGFPQAATALIIFLVMAVCFAVNSIILNHHWKHYEMDTRRRHKARVAYFSVSGLIFLFMLVSLIFTLQ